MKPGGDFFAVKHFFLKSFEKISQKSSIVSFLRELGYRMGRTEQGSQVRSISAEARGGSAFEKHRELIKSPPTDNAVFAEINLMMRPK